MVRNHTKEGIIFIVSIVNKVKKAYRNAEGLGDIVADAIKVTTGIKATEDCGCYKRRKVLNKWIPFHKRK